MRSSTVLMLLGAFFVIGGALALANPLAASLAVTTFAGVIFLIGGALQLWYAFRESDQPHRLWNGFIGVMGVVAGVFLLADPLRGMVSLTLLLGILFLLTGGARLAGAFAVRGQPLFWMLLVSGAASVLLGALILFTFPATASTLLGILLGIELIVEGVALFALGITARKIH